MRNLWYPTKKAEFMTASRFKELGLSKNDVGERDPMFGMQIEFEEEVVQDAVEAVAGLPRGAVALGAGAGQPALETPNTPAVEIEHIAVSTQWASLDKLRSSFVSDTWLITQYSIYSPIVLLSFSPL